MLRIDEIAVKDYMDTQDMQRRNEVLMYQVGKYETERAILENLLEKHAGHGFHLIETELVADVLGVKLGKPTFNDDDGELDDDLPFDVPADGRLVLTKSDAMRTHERHMVEAAYELGRSVRDKEDKAKAAYCNGDCAGGDAGDSNGDRGNDCGENRAKRKAGDIGEKPKARRVGASKVSKASDDEADDSGILVKPVIKGSDAVKTDKAPTIRVRTVLRAKDDQDGLESKPAKGTGRGKKASLEENLERVTKEEVVKLHRAGFSEAEIAEHTGMTKMAVKRIILANAVKKD